MAKKKPAAAAKKASRPEVPSAFINLHAQFHKALLDKQVPVMQDLLDQMSTMPMLTNEMAAMLCDAEITYLQSLPVPDGDPDQLESTLGEQMVNLRDIMALPGLSDHIYCRLLLLRALYSHRLGELEEFMDEMAAYERHFAVPQALAPELCRVRANYLLEMDEPAEALAQYEALLARPNLKGALRLEALVNSVPCLLKLERRGEARQRLQSVMADPDAVAAYRGQCLMLLPRTYKSAKDRLTSWNAALASGLLDAEDRGTALFMRHAVHQMQGDMAAASADLSAALAIPELNSDDRYECLLALAGIHMYHNRMAEAIALLDQAAAATVVDLAMPPDHLDENYLIVGAKHFMARLARVMAYIALGRLAEAKREMQAIEPFSVLVPEAQNLFRDASAALAMTSLPGAPKKQKRN